MRFSRWTPAPPLPLKWAPKPLRSAQTRMARLPNGQLELTIKHDLIRGVTREMLAWWFCHIDGVWNIRDSSCRATACGTHKIIFFTVI